MSAFALPAPLTTGTPFETRLLAVRTMPGGYQRIQRKQLYRRIWEDPPEQLAKEFCVTPEALRTLCEKHNIPWPHEDHWYRKSAGLPVVVYRMPPLRKGQARDILLGGTKRARPHPVVAALLKKRVQLRREHPKMQWFFTPCEGRRLTIMSRIFYAVERYGFVPSIGKLNIVEFGSGKTIIRCRIREKLKRSDVPISEEQHCQLPEHLRHRNLIPSGLLAFEIDAGCVAPGTRREWIETHTCSIERMLPEIIRSIRRTMLKRIEAEKEASVRREQVRAVERELWLQSDQEMDSQLWQVLLEVAGRMHAVDHVRYVVAKCEAGEFNGSKVFGDRTAGEWLAWVRARVETMPASDDFEALLDEVFRIRGTKLIRR